MQEKKKRKKLNQHALSKMGYEACKKWAKIFYKKIGMVFCPALDNQYISFNNVGFNHLIRKISIRSHNEQKKRFLLLPHAESILNNPKAIIEYRKEDKKVLVKKEDTRVFKESIVHYWTFVHFTDSKRIKVVVRQINNGSKHFYSIMDKKVEKENQKKKPKEQNRQKTRP